MKKYNSRVPIRIIPLLDDGVATAKGDNSSGPHDGRRPLRLLYVGTHGDLRQLQVVYEGCCLAKHDGIPLEVISVGASQNDEQRLLKYASVKNAVEEGTLSIVLRQPRDTLATYFDWADIGLSVAPPIPLYLEMSPTKLAEYFGAGLSVLATQGIPTQEKWVKESQAGILVPFTSKSIADGLKWYWHHRDALPSMQKNAREFAEAKLNYATYASVMAELVGEFASEIPARRKSRRRVEEFQRAA